VYNYNGTQYNGNKLDLVELIGGYSSYSKEDAENRMKEIKDNEVIFLNPKEPKQTVMNRKGVTLYMVVFLMGILAVLFGVLKILDN
jgi:hypothetical protein